MKYIHLFATNRDWKDVLDAFEAKQFVRYTSMNHMYENAAPSLTKGLDIPSLGLAKGEQTGLCDSYLITRLSAPIQVRTLTQYDGTRRFDIDQLFNPDSVRFIPGGRWKEMIIAGVIDTKSDSSTAQSLIRGLYAPIKKVFTRVNAFWVGPQALIQWKEGRRLTGAEQSPSEYDLRQISES